MYIGTDTVVYMNGYNNVNIYIHFQVLLALADLRMHVFFFLLCTGKVCFSEWRKRKCDADSALSRILERLLSVGLFLPCGGHGSIAPPPPQGQMTDKLSDTSQASFIIVT